MFLSEIIRAFHFMSTQRCKPLGALVWRTKNLKYVKQFLLGLILFYQYPLAPEKARYAYLNV